MRRGGLKRHMRLALAANCTIDLVQQRLQDILELRGLHTDCWTAPFNQYHQIVWDTSSALYRFNPDAMILHLEGQILFSDLIRNPFSDSELDRQGLARQRAAESVSLCDEVSKCAPGITVILNTIALPAIHALNGLEYNSASAFYDIVYAYNDELRRLAHTRPSVLIADVAGLMCDIGHRHWFDNRMWHLARVPWTSTAMTSLAEHYAAVISGTLGKRRKCIVLDLDNTLWGGIAGEDGPNGIQLAEHGPGAAFVEFQEALRLARKRGILLAISSKNNPADALSVVRTHPSMRLHEVDFAATRINWEDKADNLRAIAAELNLGVDALVFIDDSPAERARVRQALPELAVPEWPADPSMYTTALFRLLSDCFWAPDLTDEDRGRSAMYQAAEQRRVLAKSGGSLEDFLVSLKMRVNIGLCDLRTSPRVAQLTQKTNQFNLTSRRYALSEIVDFVSRDDIRVYWLELEDRFGREGIIGVLIVRRLGDDCTWVIDTFLLSCRILGRRVENAFLALACEDLEARKVRRLVGQYCATGRNHMVADLYPRLGFKQGEEKNEWILDLSESVPGLPACFETDRKAYKHYA